MCVCVRPGGHSATSDSVEWYLSSVGVLRTDLNEDPAAEIALQSRAVRRTGGLVLRSHELDDDDDDV